MANSGTDIGRAFVQIIPSAEGISGNVQKALDPVAEQAGESFGKKLFGKLKALAGAMALGKIIGDSLNEGGQLQQSIGGVETLFKKSASTVIANADKAFQTVGMSANEYMQNVTSFSASLLQSLGGDTAKAAKIADMAMVDMADNANKMGTSLDSITTAYQGFAKGNYTMLDNLKLGYGGTKTEMQRLLKDAQKITGVKYKLDNLNDVYEAIHVIQGELGITGTTAKEAASTLEGSANAMKAAWKNMLGAMATGGDIQTALNNVIDTFMTWAFGNLLPMIGQVIGSLPSIAMGLVDGIIEHLPEVMQTGMQMLTSIGEGITQNLPLLFDKALELISWLGNGIIAAIPQLAESAPQIVTGILDFIVQNAPRMIEAAIKLVVELANGLIASIPALWEGVKSLIESVFNWFAEQDWAQMGVDLVNLLADGIRSLIETATSAISDVCTSLWDTVTTTDWLSLGADIINGIIEGLGDVAGALWSKLKSGFDDALSWAKNFLQIGSPSKVMADEIGKWIPLGIADGIDAEANAITDAMNDVGKLITDPSVQMAVTQSAPDLSNAVARPALTIAPTINNYNSADLDEEAVAQRTVDMIVQQIQKEELVWA